MKNYTIDIVINNKFGELLTKRFAFDSLDEMRNVDINKLVDEAEDYAKENNMVVEEIYDSKEEMEFNKEDTTDEYRENLTETSDLNNPVNFAN